MVGARRVGRRAAISGGRGGPAGRTGRGGARVLDRPAAASAVGGRPGAPNSTCSWGWAGGGQAGWCLPSPLVHEGLKVRRCFVLCCDRGRGGQGAGPAMLRVPVPKVQSPQRGRSNLPLVRRTHVPEHSEVRERVGTAAGPLRCFIFKVEMSKDQEVRGHLFGICVFRRVTVLASLCRSNCKVNGDFCS